MLHRTHSGTDRWLCFRLRLRSRLLPIMVKQFHLEPSLPPSGARPAGQLRPGGHGRPYYKKLRPNNTTRPGHREENKNYSYLFFSSSSSSGFSLCRFVTSWFILLFFLCFTGHLQGNGYDDPLRFRYVLQDGSGLLKCPSDGIPPRVQPLVSSCPLLRLREATSLPVRRLRTYSRIARSNPEGRTYRSRTSFRPKLPIGSVPDLH